MTTPGLDVKGFTRYERYRDSGVEWLGEVPERWEVKRLKWSRTKTINGVWGDEPDGENDICCIRVADFDRTKFRVIRKDLTQRAISPTQRTGRELRPGDLLLEKSGGGEKQIVGCVVLYDHDEPAVTSNFVARILIAPEQSPRFWTYVHSALYAGKLNYPAIKQTTGIQNLDSVAYFDTLVGFPPLAEQLAISAFLDRETERIDTLIAKKHLLIERLQEYRTALITRAVTRGLPLEAARAAGLDPSPRLKPSGIEWLGDVPDHWEVKRLKHIASDVTVGVVVNPSTYVSDEGVPFLRGVDIAEFSIDWEGAERVPPETSDGPLVKSRLTEGDLVVVRVGEPGTAAVIPKEIDGANCASMILVRKESNFSSQWLAHGFNSLLGRSQVEQAHYGAAQKVINVGHAVEFVFFLPPFHEQRKVVQYLDDTRGHIERLQSKVEIAVERLQEYRIAIITAAVTGKIDVRRSAPEDLVSVSEGV